MTIMQIDKKDIQVCGEWHVANWKEK
jgi:hypothetical protein